MKKTLLATAAILTISSASSFAATFDLTACGISTGCGTATQFGTVVLTQVGTSVTFDVTLNAGNRFVETPTGGGALFLFNDPSGIPTIVSPTVTLNGSNFSIPGGLVGAHNQTAFSSLGVRSS